MLEKDKKCIYLFCTNIIILFILSLSIILIKFFTEDSVIIKESIVGINPVIATKSIMTYNEPLTIILENNEEEETLIQQKKSEEKGEKEKVTVKEHQEHEESQEVKKENPLSSETQTTIPFVEQQVETDKEEIMKETQTGEIQQQEEIQNCMETDYKGFSTVGKIEIPATELEIPILNQVTLEGMKNAPCLLYSTGELNQSGNHLIVGHNFRNGTIFSNNKNLKLGDKIYITTLDGNKVEYTIYHKFITTAEDVSYIKRDTNQKPEITLSCCTDDDEYRIVILAKIEN